MNTNLKWYSNCWLASQRATKYPQHVFPGDIQLIVCSAQWNTIPIGTERWKNGFVRTGSKPQFMIASYNGKATRTQWILGGQPGSPFCDDPMLNIHRQSGWWFHTPQKKQRSYV